MWDTHLHLDLLGDDASALLAAAAALGVRALVGVGTDPRSPATPPCALPASLVVGYAVGLHPQELQRLSDEEIDAAIAALERRAGDALTVAVGECGLDGRRGIGDDAAALARQRDVFRRQLDIAVAYGLPVVLHGVRRDGAMLEELDRLRARGAALAGCVWHGFSGSADTARAAVARGVVISVGFMALEPRARRLREAIPTIPDDALVLETDAPPLAPARLAAVAAAVASLRGQTLEHVVAVTSQNAARLFAKHPASHAARAAGEG